MEGSRCGSCPAGEGPESLLPHDLHGHGFHDHDHGHHRDRAPLDLGRQPSHGCRRPLPPQPKMNAGSQLLS